MVLQLAYQQSKERVTVDDQSVISIENAVKYYNTDTGTVHALAGFNGSIKKGEFVCLLGPSGCGKSTLLWAIGGLHDLSGGRIMLNGTPITGPRGEIGFVFQDPNLLPWRTVMQNVYLPFEVKGINFKESPYKENIDYLLEVTGLKGFENKYPRELSGGMQQRAAIVRALAYNPSVLLMDEPFGALDALTREEMNMLVMRVWADTKKTICFVTHNISEAVFIADRVFMMTARPGRLQRVFNIDLPRPREVSVMNTPKFMEMVQEIKDSIGGQEE